MKVDQGTFTTVAFLVTGLMGGWNKIIYSRLAMSLSLKQGFELRQELKIN